jgi:hypothetical protein
MGKPHDLAARRHARQVYEQHGAQAAADATGISIRSIRRWALAERWPRRLAVAQDGQKMAERSHAARIGWQTRRRTMADQLGEVGAQLLEAIQRDLAERKRLNLRDAGILLGIMLDKAELLAAQTGATWSGDVSPEESIAHINRVLDAIEERAVGHGG